MQLSRLRTGATLVELLLFIVIVSMVGVVVVNLLFQSTEARILQETQAQVEQNGAQMLQEIAEVMRNGSRILFPSQTGSTGAMLSVEKAGYEYPVVFSLSGGYLVRSEGPVGNYVSSDQVSVTDFVVTSTSVGEGEQSVFIRFTVSRVIRLSAPRSYIRVFESTFSLYADEARLPPRHTTPLSGMLSAAAPVPTSAGRSVALRP